MCGGGGLGNFFENVFGGVSNVASNLLEDIVDTAESVVETVADFVVEDVVFNTAATAFEAIGLEAVGNTFRQIGETITAGLDATISYAGTVLKDPKQIYTGQDGHFDILKTITFAAAAVFAFPSWGASVAAWTAMYGGAISAITVQMVKNGWINATTAFVINIIGNALLAYVTFGGYLPSGSAAVGAIEGLEAIGVSSEVALQVGLFIQNATQYVYIAEAALSGYGIYQTYRDILEMERELKAKEAEIDAWINNMKMKSAKEDMFIASFVDCSYYKRLPGQPLFNVYLPGRERFIPVNVQKPSWWIEGYWAHGEDIEIASLMWSDKNFDKPGGSNFMNTLKS